MPKHSKTKVGFWYSEHEPELPIPVANSDGLDKSSRQKITNYLNSRVDSALLYKGCSCCRICGISNGNQEGYDDEYLWPSGLSHYVKEHHVKLPEDFIKKILSNS